MDNFYEEALKLKEELIEWRRYLHAHAEVETELPVTTAYVKEKLRGMGYEPKEICKSGLLAEIGNGGGKTFLIRGDMDALPINEETELEYSSKTKNMHACGHDLHTAMMLGAAKILKKFEGDIKGTVKLMFQPAEETLVGAKSMIEAGVLDNPKVDAAMMLHVFSDIDMKAGAVLFFGRGVVGAASDWFRIDIKGRGGHGSMPHMAVDPLTAAAHIQIGLAQINSREIPPDKTGVVTAGQIHGGTTSNIIPDKAYITGTIRTFDEDIREMIKKRLKEIAQGIGRSFRCDVEVSYSKACPTVYNDPELFDSLLEYTRGLVDEEKILDVEKVTGKPYRMPGSEDFAYVGRKVPSVMLVIDAQLKKEGVLYPQHHPKVLFDEDVMPLGTAVYVNSTIKWLEENS